MKILQVFFGVLFFLTSKIAIAEYVTPVVQVYEDNCWAATTQAITGIPQVYLTERIRGHSHDKSLGMNEHGPYRQILAEHGYDSGFRFMPGPVAINHRLGQGNLLMVHVRTGQLGNLHSVAVEPAGTGALGIRRFVTVTDPDDGSRCTQSVGRFLRQNRPHSMVWIRPSR